jgi:hyperosmotically inducible periplasmic protein
MHHLRGFFLIVCLFCVIPAAAAADRSTSPAVNDSALTAKVKSALTTGTGAQGRNIQVETRDGVVQLSGFVDSESARSTAVMRARSVGGVAEVRDSLSVRSEARPVQQRQQ